jgi:hypothetical protein
VQIVPPGATDADIKRGERLGREAHRRMRLGEQLARQPKPPQPPRTSVPAVRAPRARQHSTRRARARAPNDDGPEPPPALEAGKRYTLRCGTCGGRFTSARPHSRTCSPACRQRRYVAARPSEDLQPRELRRWWLAQFTQHEIDEMWAGISLFLNPQGEREGIAA